MIGYPEWWPGNLVKRDGTKAAYAKNDSSPIPGLSKEQHELFLETFKQDKDNQRIKKPRVANLTGKQEDDDEWVVDSGATEHITYNLNCLYNRTEAMFEAPVTIANRIKVLVKGKGECTLTGGTKTKDVLYVLDFNCNLLCVGQLSNDLQCVVSFFPDFCVMQNLSTRSLIGAGKRDNGLYRMGMVRKRKKGYGCYT